MIKRRHYAVILGVVSALFLASCASTPEPAPEPVEEVPAVTEEQPEPEAQPEPVQEVAADFSESNNELLEKANEARQAAIDAGASGAALDALDKLLQSAKDQSSDSSKDLSQLLKDLAKKYQILEAAEKARASKNRIDELNFASYDQKDYDASSALLSEVDGSDVSAESTADLLKKAGDAKAGFDKVLDTAFRNLANEERKAALESKKNADSVKASVSRKADYDKAVDAYRLANSCYVTGDPEGSYNNYKKSKEIFQSLYEEIYERRVKAQAAIDEAKKRVAESEQAAAGADEESPITGDDVAGIEDEDATLLQADDFSEAEATVVTLEGEESVDGEDASQSSDESTNSTNSIEESSDSTDNTTEESTEQTVEADASQSGESE